MDPGIAGTIPPPADKFNRRIVANADGSLRLLLLTIPEAELPMALTTFVADASQMVWLGAERSSPSIQEEAVGGVRNYYLKIQPQTLPPGCYQAHVLACKLHLPDLPKQYVQQSFTVPDTPFTSLVWSAYRPAEGMVDAVIRSLIDDGLLQSIVDRAVEDELVQIPTWKVWQF